VTVQLSASILSADFSRLGEGIAAAERGGADQIHLDVMDGHFVPNISFGHSMVATVRRVTSLPLDVHLMIADPDRYLDAFAKAGAATMSVHAEAVVHLHRTLTVIRELGCRAGVALNPSTPLSAIEEVVPQIDQLLIMSVDPGFGGQAFIPGIESKIARARELLARAGSRADIEVDGGIAPHTVRLAVGAGATLLVAGSSIFGTPDPEAAARTLKTLAVDAASTPLRS
jgi:ribulose-phosphate 3-epimerase